MSLVQLQRVAFSVGGPLLLEHVDLSIEANERVCVVGRNGEGKTTLLKLISGELRPDDGEVRVQNGIVITRLSQEVPQDTAGSIFDVVSEGLGELGHLLARYQHLLAIGNLDALGNAQAQIEAQHGWDLNRRVEEILAKLQLREQGQQRRLPLPGEMMHTREFNARAEDLPCRLMRARCERPQHVWAQPAVAATVEAP